MLGTLVALLGAAAAIADKRESLRWLWALLVVAGALAGVAGAVLASPWWQHRQESRHRRAEVAAERARDQREHFEPRGRGVLPFGRRRGWYFTGRFQALRELAGWLAAPPGGQPAVRVVTGDPGAGKSAVLGRLVLLADPTRRQAALRADPDLDPATVPPEGCIALSVHAHGRTSQQVIEAIATRVGVEAVTVEDLLEVLERQARPVTVVVDALDEAAAAEELASVLARLAQTGGLRLLIGVRRHLVGRLVASNQALDLDAPAYLAAGDVAAYVRRCLLLEADPDALTPYRGQPALAGRIAEAVAARAGGSFLVAQLVSLALVNAGQVVDVDKPGWRERFPREVGEAMRAYLDGFGIDRSKVRDLLMPLAFAEGEGLADREFWAALAAELGTAVFTPQDVGWLLRDTSASNLLQRTELEGGAVAWRLFHQALAEYLRDGEVSVGPGEVQDRITQLLVDRAPVRDGQREWMAADAYTRSHLPAHAAAAGRLDEFIGDPGVLLAAEPGRLMPVLSTVTSPAGWAAARAYQQAVHQLTGDRPLEQRASCLQRAARYCGATDLAERIMGLGIELPWITRWAHWQTSGAFRQLIGHTGTVEAVALVQVDGEPVIVSGGDDGTLRIWDARSGQPRGKPATGHTGGVVALASGQIDREPVIVSGGEDNTVRIWNARSGQPRAGGLLAGHTGAVWAMALGQIDHEPVIVSGSEDGTVRVWDARSGQPRAGPLTGHTGGIEGVALGTVDGEPVIVSGSEDGTVRVWDARSARPRGKPFRGHGRLVRAVAIGQIDGQPVIVSGGGEDNTVRIWDARSGQPRGKPLTGHAGRQPTGVRFVLAQIDDEPVIVSAGGDGTVRLWDARSGRPRAESSVGHSRPIWAVAVGEIDGELMIISGADDNTVRVWDTQLRERFCIEADGDPRRVVCTPEGLIVVATGLGLVAFQVPAAVGKKHV